MSETDAAESFDPADHDARLFHELRRMSLMAITRRRSSPDGAREAWEACVSYADYMTTTCSPEFVADYVALRAKALGGKYPSRSLWRRTTLEARRRGMLGTQQVPVAKQDWGVP